MGPSIVVTINQFVLSRELGAVGEQRRRMQEAIGFRRDVEEHVNVPVSPAEPAAFLQELLDIVERRADDLAAKRSVDGTGGIAAY